MGGSSRMKNETTTINIPQGKRNDHNQHSSRKPADTIDIPQGNQPTTINMNSSRTQHPNETTTQNGFKNAPGASARERVSVRRVLLFLEGSEDVPTFSDPDRICGPIPGLVSAVSCL
jgi:hypothetical protein